MSKSPKNDPTKAGCLAGRKETFGPLNRYAVAPVHTRFDAVEWFVWDAEGELSRMTATPPVIRQATSKAEALEGLEGGKELLESPRKRRNAAARARYAARRDLGLKKTPYGWE